MIVAALDSGMRWGEMIALRWADIDRHRHVITLRGETTKSGRTRQVPIATVRFLSVLDWLRLDVSGQNKPDDAPVFSNEVGEPVKYFPRTAWETTVLRAHGIAPTWDRAQHALAPQAVAAFKRIDLHWHDLRHEFCSRLVERGVPLSQVRDLAGHRSIVTTERYDNQTFEPLQAASKKLDDGKTFAAGPRQPVKFWSISPKPASQTDEADAENDPADEGLDGGEGQNRTVDTTIFSRMLYQLSYLATRWDEPSS